MADTIRWLCFTFYTVGAIGGCLYLYELVHDYIHLRSMRDNGDDDGGGEPIENIVQLHPQQVSKEAPISARYR